MNNNDKLNRVHQLRDEIKAIGGSPKKLARLRMSIANTELARLLRELPGSVRRGMARGRC